MLRAVAALAIIGFAAGAAAPSPASLGSSLTFLYQNDLDWTKAPEHKGAILLKAQTHAQAVASCDALGETLLVPSGAHFSSDIRAQLAFLAFKKQFPAGQQFWVSAAGKACRSIDALGLVLPSACSRKLPALCSQSAPFRSTDNQDTSERFHTTVTSGGRAFIGYRDHLSFRFMGVRYGNTPQRFTYSTVFSGAQKAFNNTVKGSQCMQTAGGGSEDCLFLNIFTPFLPSAATRKSELRPVLFHIHGGAYTGGSANDGTFDGGSFASRGDLVVVDINYRLSTLGYLALADGVTNGSFGISDQVTALDWVRANIASFGGDPDRITLVGQSAGASSVRILMASPKAIGKFSAAIPMSNLAGLNFATIFSDYPTIEQEVQQSAIPILALTGCNTTTSTAATLACLRAFDAQKLVNLPTIVRTPVVDGTYITSSQLPVDGSAPVARVPVLMGIMRDDGAAFIGFPTNANLAQQVASIISTVPASNIINSGLFDPPTGPNATLNVFNVTSRITTNIEFRCLDLASVFSSVKRKLFPNMWFYQFDRSYQTPGFNPNFPTCDPPKDDAHPLGDTTKEYFHCHSGELYYAWGTLGQFSLPFRDSLDLPFSQFVQDHWISFAHTHDPNPDPALLLVRGYTETLKQLARTGRWQPVTTRNLRMKIFDTPARFEAFQEKAQCDFLGFPLDFYEH